MLVNALPVNRFAGIRKPNVLTPEQVKKAEEIVKKVGLTDAEATDVVNTVNEELRKNPSLDVQAGIKKASEVLQQLKELFGRK